MRAVGNPICVSCPSNHADNPRFSATAGLREESLARHEAADRIHHFHFSRLSVCRRADTPMAF